LNTIGFRVKRRKRNLMGQNRGERRPGSRLLIMSAIDDFMAVRSPHPGYLGPVTRLNWLVYFEVEY
jgi:hypothetical protein